MRSVGDGSTEHPTRRSGVLYLIISGAPAPEGIPELVAQCQAAGWQVLTFSTPLGVRFTDPDALERLTGQPLRSDYRMPATGKTLPAADGVLACPLTFNSVNKFAHGHADNFAIGLLCELAATDCRSSSCHIANLNWQATQRSRQASPPCAAWE